MRGLSQALSLLMTRAAPNLTADDARTLSGASELAALIAGNASAVFSGIGALTAADENVGSFRGNDLSELAFLAANLFDAVEGLVELADSVPVPQELRPVEPSVRIAA